MVSVGDGYVLRLPADAVDVRRFAAAARRATGAPAGERVARCDEALGWWTGTPYADCADTGLVRGEVDRLTETRLSLLEARASALLDLGRPDVVVRELAPVAREHPFREGLWSLLALGQYRTLRQADALATLRELRRRLAGELGIDPYFMGAGNDLDQIWPGVREKLAEIKRRVDPVHTIRSNRPVR